MALISAHLQAQGNMIFERNSAMFGGGLAMEDRCLVSCSLLVYHYKFKVTLSQLYASCVCGVHVGAVSINI